MNCVALDIIDHFIQTTNNISLHLMKLGSSFIIGTGFSFSYALKHNIVWRTSLDYDFTRHSYDSQQFRLAIHQLTPGIALCYAF